MGGLLRRRRGIRAAGSLREVLSGIPLVDHHAHGVLRAPPASLDEFRGLFSESLDPRQWPHVATGVTYRRAVRVLAEFLGCDATEQAVYERRLADELLTSALGPILTESYLAVRRSEWAAYSTGDEAFEQQGHFEKY